MLKQFLDDYKISKARAAEIAGSTTRTVDNWLAGKNPTPRSIVLIMEAVREGKVDLEWIEAKARTVGKNNGEG